LSRIIVRVSTLLYNIRNIAPHISISLRTTDVHVIMTSSKIPISLYRRKKIQRCCVQ